ncbi:MAG TPA: sulfotransferase [Thermoanaerobaculia bacterium]
MKETATLALPDERLFFLVGRGRSGTELFRAILDAHQGISVAPEALFILNLARAYRRRRWNEQRVQRFAHHLFLDDRMRLWDVTRESLEATWNALPSDATFARRCAEVYEAHARANGKSEGCLLGDKNPTFSLFVPELMELFPRAKFVHVVRDYRDNVLSHRNVPFDLNNIAALAYRWKRYNGMILAASERAPERFHRVRYEDLVQSPVPVMERLCNFLGVQSSEAMLRARAEDDPSAPAWHQHRRRPVDADLAGRWQGSFSPKDVAVLDRICQPLGCQLGYTPATAESSHAWQSGIALGWAMTQSERLLFRFPVAAQALILRAYRHLTGSIVR